MGKDKNMAAKNAKVRKFDLAAGKERTAIKVIDEDRPVTRITDIVRDYYAIPYYDGEWGLRDYKDTLEVIPWTPVRLNPCYDPDNIITHQRMYMRGYEGWVSQWDDYGNPKYRIVIESFEEKKRIIAHSKRTIYACLHYMCENYAIFDKVKVWKWGESLSLEQINKDFSLNLVKEGEYFYNEKI